MTIKAISLKEIRIIILANSPVLVQSTRINTTDYCLCNNCQPMPTAAESVCCQEIPHIQGKFKGTLYYTLQKAKNLQQSIICRHNCKQKYKQLFYRFWLYLFPSSGKINIGQGYIEVMPTQTHCGEYSHLTNKNISDVYSLITMRVVYA